MKDKKVLKICAAVFGALAIALAAFFAGFFIHGCTRPGGAASYEWVLDMIEKNYYFGGVDKDYTGTSINAITEKYLDRYSQYYTAEQYEQVKKSNAGSKSGIGVSYAFVEGKGVYVSSVVCNSPAYISGLRAGEWLESGSAGGKDVAFSSASDVAKLFGGADDGEEIKLSSTDGAAYTVAKSEYTASYTYMCTNATAWAFGDAAGGGLALYEKPTDKISYLPDGAAYIRLTQFYGSAAKEFSVLVEKFNALECTSLILDLRSNGGGYVSVMQEIAGAFADGAKKIAMLSRDKHGDEESYYCAKVTNAERRISKDTEVYVLANGGTASASEALMGAMICYGALKYENIFLSQYSEEYKGWLEKTGQEVKDARTYGKGIMQSTFENPSTGEALKLTTAKIFWPDGKTSIHDRGVLLSDGCKAAPAAWQHTKGDEELKGVIVQIIG